MISSWSRLQSVSRLTPPPHVQLVEILQTTTSPFIVNRKPTRNTRLHQVSIPLKLRAVTSDTAQDYISFINRHVTLKLVSGLLTSDPVSDEGKNLHFMHFSSKKSARIMLSTRHSHVDIALLSQTYFDHGRVPNSNLFCLLNSLSR